MPGIEVISELSDVIPVVRNDKFNAGSRPISRNGLTTDGSKQKKHHGTEDPVLHQQSPWKTTKSGSKETEFPEPQAKRYKAGLQTDYEERFFSI